MLEVIVESVFPLFKKGAEVLLPGMKKAALVVGEPAAKRPGLFRAVCQVMQVSDLNDLTAFENSALETYVGFIAVYLETERTERKEYEAIDCESRLGELRRIMSVKKRRQDASQCMRFVEKMERRDLIDYGPSGFVFSRSDFSGGFSYLDKMASGEVEGRWAVFDTGSEVPFLDWGRAVAMASSAEEAFQYVLLMYNLTLGVPLPRYRAHDQRITEERRWKDGKRRLSLSFIREYREFQAVYELIVREK